MYGTILEYRNLTLEALEPDIIDLERLYIRKRYVLGSIFRIEKSGKESEFIDLDRFYIRKVYVFGAILRIGKSGC